MTTTTLSILGVGCVLPRREAVRDLVVAAGGSTDGYAGWDHVRIGGPDDHPGSLATRALAQALTEASVDVGELVHVISVGVSRDYPPSWSVATEVMKSLGAAPTCLGFDLTVGCLGVLVALNLIPGLLAATGGVAAIVAAERWADTVERGNPATRPLWGHSDGASALLLRLGPAPKALARFEGAVFHSYAEWNDLVLVKHGGTRFPTLPEGTAGQRSLRTDVTPREVFATYQQNYGAAYQSFLRRFSLAPHRLICNQISPNTVSMIAEIASVPLDRTSQLGHDTGHVGSSDLLLGLHDLIARGEIDSPIALAASTPYACGFGLVRPT